MKNLRPLVLLTLGALGGAAMTLAGLYWLLPPSATKVAAALRSTRLASVDFRETPYSDALRVIAEQMHAAGPDLRGVRLEVVPTKEAPGADSNIPQKLPDDPLWGTGDPNITLTLRDVPVWETLLYITNLADLEYSVRDGVVYFRAHQPSSPMPSSVKERLTANANVLFERLQKAFEE